VTVLIAAPIAGDAVAHGTATKYGDYRRPGGGGQIGYAKTPSDRAEKARTH
jgi:hypothetical protein